MQNLSQLSNNLNFINWSGVDNGTFYYKSNPFNFYNSTTIGGVVNTSYYVPYNGATQNVNLGNNNFSVGTSDFFVNNNTGNVGIGTTSPGATLDVVGNEYVRSGNLFVDNITYYSGGATPMILGNTANGFIALRYDNGNVGIGTTNPNSILQLEGNSGTRVMSIIFNDTLAGYQGTWRLGDDGKPGMFGLMINSSNNYAWIVDGSNGNIGIGTTTPQNKLNVVGDANITGNLYGGTGTFSNQVHGGDIGISQQNDYTPYMRLGMDINYDQYLANNAYWNGSAYNYVSTGGYGGAATAIHQNSGIISFDTANGGTNPITWNSRMYISNNGSIGINTTTPQNKLNVVGDANITGNLYGGTGTFSNQVHGGDIGISQQNDYTPYMRLGMDINYDQYLANNAYWNGSAYNYVSTGGYGGAATAIHQNSGIISFDTANGGTNPITWNSRMYISNNGSIGINTTTPQNTLNVIGTGNFTGKVTASTFDPPYTIGNITYSTYAPGINGVKEEVSDTIDLSGANNTYTIDFSKLKQGSDLWLFYQITDFGQNWTKMQVMLTSGFDGRVWYTKDPTKKTLTIHGTAPGEVSYRLTADRYDWRNWENTLASQNETKMPLIEKS